MKKIFAALMITLCVMVSCSWAENETLKIDGSMGKLSAVIQKPELKAGEKCRIVMILHGFTGSKNEKLLTALADALESRGIASVRFDFNGHGESEGDFTKMTVLNEIEDARKVFEYVRDLRYVDGVSVAGHSQGGVVASMLAGELGAEDIHSVVLLAPAAVLRDDAIRGNIFGVAFDAANPPESVKIFDRYSIGRDYVLTAQTLPIYPTAEKFTGAVCLIHGTADRIVPYTFSEHYHRLYRNSELHLMPGVDHGFTGAENEAAKIAADFLMK